MIDCAVILAAGRGTRLGKQGTMAPKGFLRLGDKPIIEESLLRLQRAGIRRAVIVTGHLVHFYEELAARSGGPIEIPIETVHNPRYADSGSMYSLSLAKNKLLGDFLLLESDLIYEQRALAHTLNYPEDNLVLLSGATGSGDEVYVETKPWKGLQRLVDMSKERRRLGENIAGELVGISKISRSVLRVMLEKAEDHFRETLMMDYETDALVAAGREIPVYCDRVDDLLWAEIDDAAHWERARTEIYPGL
ncbi:MAG: 2-aminoethylphosphonate-pyruvate transaminase [Candidatus Kentron sp. G]|nr:MAG: 2-aminoethylphosphonate-pyruvate transaminase [Candidatus Kentron sp. G]VFM97888.1 MAG: 2-aminoethylphosphonate-pyruvate transaminase [Candidatus Kentron sp. G]VFN00098.1 MAG: 2-aminoethylphosphonate-pyruvate transaminase [Candidatus Kentron sp. G]